MFVKVIVDHRQFRRAFLDAPRHNFTRAPALTILVVR